MDVNLSTTVSSATHGHRTVKRSHGHSYAIAPPATPPATPTAYAAEILDDTDGINAMIDAGTTVVDFDADMHDIASVHLRRVCPETQLSINYVASTNNLTSLYDDLDWTRLQFHRLDDEQFSLYFVTAHRAATAMSTSNPNRAVLLAEFDAKEKKWDTLRHRLETRERHLHKRINAMKDVLHQMEREQLNEWEQMKAQVRSYE